MKHTKVDINSAARSYRSRFENRPIVDAHIEDAFCAGAAFIQQQNLQQCNVICRWEMVTASMPNSGDRCLLVTKSKMIIAGDWYRDGWRTEWSRWEYDAATDRQKLSLLPKDDIIAWMLFPPLPNGI